MTDVSVLVPWRAGNPDREAHWRFFRPMWEQYGEVVEGACPPGEKFNRAWAILDAFSQSSGEVLVVVDADVLIDPTEAIQRAAGEGWAIPHRFVTRLTPLGSELCKAELARDGKLGEFDVRDKRMVEEHHLGNETGTCVVLHRSLMRVAPPDPRFFGWGQEDDAWQRALRCMMGPCWRGTERLLHFWHPPQPRNNRTIGSYEGLQLRRRYENAQGSRHLMSKLLAESEPLRERILSSSWRTLHDDV
jgi:glycosyltransferase involved in cell wall biosynthesis